MYNIREVQSRSGHDFFCSKVKGKKSTYKFDKLPYEYNPGVTRRRRTASYRWKISTSPEHGVERGNYSTLTQLNSSGADAGFMPPYAQRSSQLTSLQPKAQIWFPEEARALHNKFERRRVNNWGTLESTVLESRNPSPLLFADEQNAVGNVTSSLVTNSKSLVTPQSYHSSSDLSVAKQNISHEVSLSFVCANPASTQSTNPQNVEQQNASRNDKPSAAMSPEKFASVTPESSQSRSPLYLVEKNASRNDTPSADMYADTFASVTEESSHLRSPLYRYVEEKNTSRNNTRSVAMYADTLSSSTPESSHLRSPLYRYDVEENTSRNNTRSAAMYADALSSVTPESSHLRSPLYRYDVEKNASCNGLPSHLAYASVYVTDSVLWPTPVFPPVHRIPYLPLMYAVPVQYERLPVITTVTGNYSGHPSQDK